MIYIIDKLNIMQKVNGESLPLEPVLVVGWESAYFVVDGQNLADERRVGYNIREFNDLGQQFSVFIVHLAVAHGNLIQDVIGYLKYTADFNVHSFYAKYVLKVN